MVTYEDIINRRILERNPRLNAQKTFPFYSKFGCVYFVRSGDFVKIGRTTALYIELLGLLIRENYLKLEQELQKQFSTYHLRGEWFWYSEELNDYINIQMNDFDRTGLPLYRAFLFNYRTTSKNQRDFLESREV